MTTAIDNSKNPFADYGKIVFGDKFVGRAEALQDICQRVQAEDVSGNVAIIGLPRVGKSSLLWQALLHNVENHHLAKRIPLWICCSDCADIFDFYHTIIAKFQTVWRRLQRLNLAEASPDIEAFAAEARRATNWTELKLSMQSLFADVLALGWRIVLVLDEFDAFRTLFRDHAWAFQGLRELSTNPAFGVSLAVASRRPIAEIEEACLGVSNIAGTFHEYYLPFFTDSERHALIERLLECGLDPTDSLQKTAKIHCAGHPLLLGAFGYELARQWITDNHVDLDSVTSWSGTGVAFTNCYKDLSDFLDEINLLTPLLQILFGPQTSPLDAQLDVLLKYGVLLQRSDGQNGYWTFTKGYYSYLSGVERSKDLWPLWNRTERALRRLLSDKFYAKYGRDWDQKLASAHPEVKSIIDECKNTRGREISTRNALSNSELLDFTMPKDLWPLLECHWDDLFRPILRRDTSYWDPKLRLVTSIRNPLAHSREPVSEGKRKQAEGICNEVLELLES